MNRHIHADDQPKAAGLLVTGVTVASVSSHRVCRISARAVPDICAATLTYLASGYVEPEKGTSADAPCYNRPYRELGRRHHGLSPSTNRNAGSMSRGTPLLSSLATNRRKRYSTYCYSQCEHVHRQVVDLEGWLSQCSLCISDQMCIVINNVSANKMAHSIAGCPDAWQHLPLMDDILASERRTAKP